MVLQRRLVDRKPDQGRRPTMAADQRQHDRRLVIGIEVGPVHGDNDLRARPDRMGDPSFREFVDVNSRVREQPIHLLDGVFGLPAPR